MTAKERESKLNDATALVQSVVDDLDVSVEKCGSCKLQHAVNWTEAEAHKQLGSIIGKLRKLGKRLGPEPTKKGS